MISVSCDIGARKTPAHAVSWFPMWLLYVLAEHLRWYGLLDIGLAMIDGSYYRTSIFQDNFSGGSEPSVDFSGGD